VGAPDTDTPGGPGDAASDEYNPDQPFWESGGRGDGNGNGGGGDPALCSGMFLSHYHLTFSKKKTIGVAVINRIPVINDLSRNPLIF
jgi:hypothetical protein